MIRANKGLRLLFVSYCRALTDRTLECVLQHVATLPKPPAKVLAFITFMHIRGDTVIICFLYFQKSFDSGPFESEDRFVLRANGI